MNLLWLNINSNNLIKMNKTISIEKIKGQPS